MEVANWGYQMLLKFLLLNDEDDGKMRSQNKVESKFNVVTECEPGFAVICLLKLNVPTQTGISISIKRHSRMTLDQQHLR